VKGFIYLKNVVTLELEQDKCIGCGMCLVVCPHAVLELENGRVCIGERDACMECGACAMNCPTGAVSVCAGVGCATAVINSLLGRESSSCCCTIDSTRTSGGVARESGEANRTGCCP
jgi:ferredoxin